MKPLWKNAPVALTLAALLASCTSQLPGSFRYTQKVETFSTSKEVNTSIDLLWVVDNSASMDVAQAKLRAGFSAFAHTYLKPNWDIRLAVITTDTYLANPVFQAHLNSVIPGTVGYRSTYLATRAVPFVNPSTNPTLYDSATGRFPSGVRYNDLAPAWGNQWARLVPGMHDGPLASLCAEFLPYFLRGTSLCSFRDALTFSQATTTGTSSCLNPNGAAGESSVTGCINTTQVDVLHSGNPILFTQPPAGTPADDAWINQLVDDFLINVSVGSSGQGSERALSSVLQLLQDNEATESRFFRPNSLRGMIFVGDEDDQSMDLSQATSGISPQSHYQCDFDRLSELNPGDARVSAQCPNTGFHCPEKTVDGFSYRVSMCPNSTAPLLPISEVKASFDRFFSNLDQSQSNSPNYFVVGIIPTTASSIQLLQAARMGEDQNVGALKNWAVDRGDRFTELATLVANGSTTLDIADSDFSPILDTIGRTIVQKKATFTLDREPSSLEELLIWIQKADGTRTALDPAQFVISGTTLQITDLDLVLALSSTDHVVIDYQPKNL